MAANVTEIKGLVEFNVDIVCNRQMSIESKGKFEDESSTAKKNKICEFENSVSTVVNNKLISPKTHKSNILRRFRDSYSRASFRTSKLRCNDSKNHNLVYAWVKSKDISPDLNCKTNDENISGKSADTKSNDDEFSPTVDMMIHDYDDERTLDEEESLVALEDPQVELSSLRKEGDMPLADLIAKYGIQEHSDKNDSSEEFNDQNVGYIEDKPDPSELEQFYDDSEIRNSGISMRSTRYGSRQQSEDEEDIDYCPEEEEKKKTIMVGSDYQASIPEGLCKYDDSLPYENEDKLVWDPLSLSVKEIEEYLVKAQEPILNNTQTIASIPRGLHIRDDEQSLFLLLQCGYNVEEALRRRRINAVPPTDSMSLWSEEECKHFENGLRTFGKDFRQIHQNKVKTRSVGEIVQFYYLWKKTERHDIFANKSRLEKKKYSLHPAITDYMDRFLEEQDGPCSRDRSISPNIQNLSCGENVCNSISNEKVQKEDLSQSDSSKHIEKYEKKIMHLNDKILLNSKKNVGEFHP